MRGPRIGRPDQLAREQAGAALGPPAVARLLVAPTPPPAPPAGASRQAVIEAAGQLAELLDPLPNALAELGTRITRHCAHTARDAELARLVDLVRGRTFDLFLAVRHLRDAGRIRCLAGALALLLLAGCAPKMPPLSATATDADRSRAEVCHRRAAARAEESTAFKNAPESPAKEWQAWEIALAPVLLVGAAVEVAMLGVVAIATAPWMLASEHTRRKDEYQRIYTACMGEPQATIEPPPEETTR